MPVNAKRILRRAQQRRTVAVAITFVNICIQTVALPFLAFLLALMVAVTPEYLGWTGAPAVDESDQSFKAQVNRGFASVVRHINIGIYFWAMPSFYIAHYLLPFVLTLPLSAFVVGLWARPPRLLLLRPFNRGRLTRPLRRLVRTEIGNFGHVYTLADTDIRVRWYVRVPLLLGQFALLSFRARRIRGPRQVARLSAALDRTWLRNVNWCLAVNKSFPIASSDACWQQVVQLLVERVDAILVDAVDLRPNVLWEIELCRRLQREQRVLFLVPAERRDEALATLGELLPSEGLDRRVVSYAADGRLDSRSTWRLRRGLARLAAPTAALGGEHDAGGASRFAVAAVILFVLQLLPVLSLGLPLQLGPAWRYGPDPIAAPFVVAINPAAWAVFGAGVLALLLLLVAGRGRQPLRSLAIIQVAVLAIALFKWKVDW